MYETIFIYFSEKYAYLNAFCFRFERKNNYIFSCVFEALSELQLFSAFQCVNVGPIGLIIVISRSLVVHFLVEMGAL